MSTRVFRTRRGRITLTDETLLYEPTREPQRRVSCARAEITEMRVVTHVYWFAPAWTEITVRHRGGVLHVAHVGRRTANALRRALGF
jgi:hypothetical protein